MTTTGIGALSMRASIAAYVQGQSSPDANFHVLLAGAQLSLPASAGHQAVAAAQSLLFAVPTVSNAHSSGLTAEQRLRLAVATFRVLNQTLAENNDTDKSLSEGQYLPCHDANDEGFELVALKLLADPWSAVRSEAVKGCARVLLLGPGGGRPAPASFLNACFRCLGVPDLLTAAHDASAGASSDDKSDIISDDVSNEGSSLNEIDWRLAEALMKLCSELAKNLKSTILKSSAGYCSAVVELLSTLGRPGLAVDLLAVLAHEQASVRVSVVSAINALVELSCVLDTNDKSGNTITASSITPQQSREVQHRNSLVDAVVLRWRNGMATTTGDNPNDDREKKNNSSESCINAAEAEGLLSLLALQLGAMPWPKRSLRWQHSNAQASINNTLSSLPLPSIENLVLEAAQWPGASSVRQAAADLATASLFGATAGRPSGNLLATVVDSSSFSKTSTAAVQFAMLESDACVAGFDFIRKLARISAAVRPEICLPASTAPSSLKAGTEQPTSSNDTAANSAATSGAGSFSTTAAVAAPSSTVEEEGLLLCQDAILSEVLVHALVLHMSSSSSSSFSTSSSMLPENVASGELLRFELGRTLWPDWSSDDALEGISGRKQAGLWGQVARSLNSDQSFEVWRMGTQLVPLLARLLTTLAALPLDSHESRVGAHVSGCRSDGSKSNSGQMHNILSKALTFALDATSPVGISVENIENGARVAAASFLRWVAVHGRRCEELLPPSPTSGAPATNTSTNEAESSTSSGGVISTVNIRSHSQWSTAHDGLVGDSEAMQAYSEALRYLQRCQPNALMLTAATARSALLGSGTFSPHHAVDASGSGNTGTTGVENAVRATGDEAMAPLALLAARSTPFLASRNEITAPSFVSSSYSAHEEDARVMSEETEALCCALAFVRASPTESSGTDAATEFTTSATIAAAKAAVALVVQWHVAHDNCDGDLNPSSQDEISDETTKAKNSSGLCKRLHQVASNAAVRASLDASGAAANSRATTVEDKKATETTRGATNNSPAPLPPRLFCLLADFAAAASALGSEDETRASGSGAMPLVPVLLRWLLSVFPVASLSKATTPPTSFLDATATTAAETISAAEPLGGAAATTAASTSVAGVIFEKPRPPPGWRWRSEADAAAAGVAIAAALVECLQIPPLRGARLGLDSKESSSPAVVPVPAPIYPPAAAAAAAFPPPPPSEPLISSLPPPPPRPQPIGADGEASAFSIEDEDTDVNHNARGNKDEAAQSLVLCLDVVAAILRAAVATNATSTASNAATVRLLSRLVECAALATNHLIVTVLPSLEPRETSLTNVSSEGSRSSGSATNSSSSSGVAKGNNRMRALAANALAKLLSAAFQLEGVGVFATVRAPAVPSAAALAPNETSTGTAAAAAAAPVAQNDELTTNEVDEDSDSSDWDASDNDDDDGGNGGAGLDGGDSTGPPCLWTFVVRTLVLSANQSAPSSSTGDSLHSSNGAPTQGSLLEEALSVLPEEDATTRVLFLLREPD